MKNTLKSLIAIFLLSSVACAQKSEQITEVEQKKETSSINVEPYEEVKVPRHRYGGWYCPDNLTGFPAVHLSEWSKVPVLDRKMPTEEEARSEASLIYVDIEKWPNAKPLDVDFPKLAYFNSPYTDREEIIIVIQGVNIDNDSILGFRYLNGGNGSATWKDVEFMTDNQINEFRELRFATGKLEIKASAEKVKSIMTNLENVKLFKRISNGNTNTSMKQNLNVNYHYKNAKNITSAYADMLFGNFYVQNDYQENNFTEKFLIVEDKDNNTCFVQYACGPFLDDFEVEREKLASWVQEVKLQSER